MKNYIEFPDSTTRRPCQERDSTTARQGQSSQQGVALPNGRPKASSAQALGSLHISRASSASMSTKSLSLPVGTAA